MHYGFSLRRLLIAALTTCALLSAVACSKKSDSGGTSGSVPPPVPPATHPLQLADSDGKPVTIGVDDKTMVVAVASWCAYTRTFITSLRNPEVKKQFEPYKLIFVLQSDEWPAAGKQLEGKIIGKKIDLPIDNALTLLKRKTGRGPIVDPAFLDTLPGDHYFLPAGFSQSTPDLGFPSLYSVESGKFDSHPMLKMRDSLKSDPDLYKKCTSQG
jgi:hypothetical protein